MNTLPTPELHHGIINWLPYQRWFAAKNHPIANIEIVAHYELVHTQDFICASFIINVEFSDNFPSQMYHIPLGYREVLPDYLLAHTIVPAFPSHTPYIYDAVYDQDFISTLSTLFLCPSPHPEINFHLTPHHHFVPHMSGFVLNLEQSNTSLALGDKIFLKFYRKLEPGLNPDVELHQALTHLQCTTISPLEGWITTSAKNHNYTLAMATTYIPNSADGWNMAIASMRDLLAEGDLLAAEMGTDFSSEAYRLGASVAEIHQALATHHSTTKTIDIDQHFNEIEQSFTELTSLLPELIPYAQQMRNLLLKAELEIRENKIPSQLIEPIRIHGDLHLGQVLRTPHGWIVIDFEGEPTKSLAERTAADSVLKDIAGMLRSFDYAALHQILLRGHKNTQHEFRAREWAERNTQAFLQGYWNTRDINPQYVPNALLTAFILEKALYEAQYELRHRPEWITIPMNAIIRILTNTDKA